MEFKTVAETFVAEQKTGKIMAAFCDKTKNNTKIKVAHEGGKVSTLIIPTASEKRLAFLKNGQKISYVCEHEKISEADGKRYYIESAASVKFI